MKRPESASFLLTHTPYCCRTFRLAIIAIEGSLAKIVSWRSRPLSAASTNLESMIDEEGISESDWQSVDHLFPAFEIAIASCEFIIDYTNLWKLFLAKEGSSFEAPRRMGPSMMKLEQVAEMAVARICRLGDAHQLDLTDLSKPPAAVTPMELFKGTEYDVDAFLTRHERELALTTSHTNDDAPAASQSHVADSVSFSAPSYFRDCEDVHEYGVDDGDEISERMVETSSNRSGGWGLYSYPT